MRWGEKKKPSLFYASCRVYFSSWLKHKVLQSRVILVPLQTSGAKIHGELDKSGCERHDSTHKPSRRIHGHESAGRQEPKWEDAAGSRRPNASDAQQQRAKPDRAHLCKNSARTLETRFNTRTKRQRATCSQLKTAAIIASLFKEVRC